MPSSATTQSAFEQALNTSSATTLPTPKPGSAFLEILKNAPLPFGNLYGGPRVKDVAPIVGAAGKTAFGLLDDTRALAVNYVDMAIGAAKELASTSQPNPAGPPPSNELSDLIGSEEGRKALRGAALVNGSIIAGPLGGAVEAVGARALGPLIAETTPTFFRIITQAARGAAEGAAFAATFGALVPMKEGDKNFADHLVGDFVKNAIFGSVLRGGLALRTPKTDTDKVADSIIDELRKASRDKAKTALALREPLPMPDEPTTATELVAQVAAGTMSQGTSRSGLVGFIGESAGALRDIVQTRFPAVKHLDYSTWYKALQTADSRYFGAWFGKRSAQYVQQGMNERERDIFWRGLISSRGRQIRQTLTRLADQSEQTGESVIVRGKTYDASGLRQLAANVNIGELPQEERMLFDMLPAIQKAKQRYAEDVLPLLTDVRVRNGLRTLVETDAPFLPLVPVSEAEVLAGIKAFRSVGGGGGTFEGTFAAQTTPGAKLATGQAYAYLADGETLLTRVFSREYAVDRKNELLANIISAPWAQRLRRGERPPRTITWNGKEYPAEVVDIKGNPSVLRNRFGVDTFESTPVPPGPPRTATRKSGELPYPRGLGQSPTEPLEIPAVTPNTSLGEKALPPTMEFGKKGKIFTGVDHPLVKEFIQDAEIESLLKPIARKAKILVLNDESIIVRSPRGSLLRIRKQGSDAGTGNLAEVTSKREIGNWILERMKTTELRRQPSWHPRALLSNPEQRGRSLVPTETALPYREPGTALALRPSALPPRELEFEYAGIEGLGDIPGEVVEGTLGRYALPQPIAKMVNELYNPLHDRVFDGKAVSDNHLLRGWMSFQDFNTGLLLASPVEASAHANRILSDLVTTIGVGDNKAALFIANRFVPWFGPRLSGLWEIFNVFDDPASLAMESRLAQIPGAIPSRAFEAEFGAPRSVAARLGAPEKVSKSLEEGRHFIFDLPEHSSGFYGFDIRARIVGAKAVDRILKAERGYGATDKELLEFITKFGQYSESVQSNLVAGLRKARIAPFAGGQAGLIVGELRSAFGGLNLPKETVEALGLAAQARLRAEVLWRGTMGTAVATIVAQYAMTKRWPWDNEEGYQKHLMVGYTEDGRGVYIPNSTFDPGTSRAMTISTVRAMMESFGEDAVSEVTRQLANTPITYVIGASPGTQAAATLLTGRSTYLGSGSVPLRVVPPQPTWALTAKERFLTAAGEANPTIENFLGVGSAEELPNAIRIINALTPGMIVGRKPLLAVSADVRERKAKLMEIVNDRVNTALEKFESMGERRRYYREESLKFPDPEQQREAFRQMLQGDVSRQIGRQRSAREAVRGGARF